MGEFTDMEKRISHEFPLDLTESEPPSGLVLLAWREWLGISQPTAARVLGVSERTYRAWENDERVPPKMIWYPIYVARRVQLLEEARRADKR